MISISGPYQALSQEISSGNSLFFSVKVFFFLIQSLWVRGREIKMGNGFVNLEQVLSQWPHVKVTSLSFRVCSLCVAKRKWESFQKQQLYQTFWERQVSDCSPGETLCGLRDNPVTIELGFNGLAFVVTDSYSGDCIIQTEQWSSGVNTEWAWSHWAVSFLPLLINSASIPSFSHLLSSRDVTFWPPRTAVSATACFNHVPPSSR